MRKEVQSEKERCKTKQKQRDKTIKYVLDIKERIRVGKK